MMTDEESEPMIELILNPVAGNGRAQRALEAVVRELSARKLEWHVSKTASSGHATALTREAIERGAGSIAVLGGDGLLSEVSVAVANTGVRLLFVPCGTGNDFIKSLQLPKDPAKALRLQLDAPERRIDCGALNGVPFMNVAGAGFDTDVLVETERHKKTVLGITPYLIGLIKAISGFKPLEAEVTLDGVTEHRRYTVVSVANGRYFGGGMKVAPMARVDDGAFDVMLIDAMPRWKLLVLAPMFLGGWHTRLAATRRVVAKDVVIKCRRPFMVNVDGELSEVACAHFQIRPGELTISCPTK